MIIKSNHRHKYVSMIEHSWLWPLGNKDIVWIHHNSSWRTFGMSRKLTDREIYILNHILNTLNCNIFFY